MDARVALILDADKCTGCSICELICSMEKTGEYNPSKSYIRLLRNWEMDVNIVALDPRCDQCNRCVDWCPTRSISFTDVASAAVIRKGNSLGKFPVPWFGAAQ